MILFTCGTVVALVTSHTGTSIVIYSVSTSCTVFARKRVTVIDIWKREKTFQLREIIKSRSWDKCNLVSWYRYVKFQLYNCACVWKESSKIPYNVIFRPFFQGDFRDMVKVRDLFNFEKGFLSLFLQLFWVWYGGRW